jgi:hypothetical protein
MALQHYNVALHCSRQNLFSLQRIILQYREHVGMQQDEKSWPTSSTHGTRRSSWLTASKPRGVAAESLLYTYMRVYIPNGTKLYSSAVLHSLKNLPTSPQLRRPNTCTIQQHKPLQSSTICKAGMLAQALVITLCSTVAGYKRCSETHHYLLHASQVWFRCSSETLWYISTRIHCQLRTQHRTSQPYNLKSRLMCFHLVWQSYYIQLY